MDQDIGGAIAALRKHGLETLLERGTLPAAALRPR